MFEQSMSEDGVRRNNPWSFAASVTVQSVLVAAALALPLMHVAHLDTKPPDILFLPRAIGAVEPVRRAPARGPASSVLLHADRSYRPFQAPSRIPNHVATGPDLPGEPDYGFPATGGGGNVMVGGIEGLPGLQQKAVLIPPEPPHHSPQPVTQPTPLRVGEGVQAAKLVFGPKPAYPALAKQARISGAVRLAAQISTDGHIQGLRVISGHPMLVPAAIEAVSKWSYKPTLLNGEPVEVLTDILVNFVLNQ